MRVDNTMAFASFDSNRSAGPMAEIDMVPLST